jgi:lipopolysaccharide transport system ATP-binding protein
VTEPLLSVRGLSKRYSRTLGRALRYGVRDIAAELLPFARTQATLRPDEFWALDDVSFDLAPGESLAVVGANGAGKSTLLKVLCGLLKPDRGEVRLRGRAEALLELGTGLNPLLTGRENVQVGAAVHGLDRRAGQALLAAVAEFAELGDFLDAPLQSYSAGMKARLSYALAAQLDPDVLLVDEVLAVGDLAFQRKCATHMRSFLDRGRALLLVSHHTFQIQSVCERGIVLEKGRLAFDGSAVDAISRMFDGRASAEAAPRAAAATDGGPVIIEDLLVEPMEGDAIRSGGAVRLRLRYRAAEDVSVLWGFTIWTADQWVCVTSGTDLRTRILPAGAGELTCVIPRLSLVGGRYTVRAAVIDAATRRPLALFGWQDAAAVLDVRANATLLGNAQMTQQQLVTIDVDWT